ncbi:MAG: hypothetical protein SFU99_07840 [Saprospiraceae bacterium]|nr:hypothetical protein [Saprospiraceae bacterium]
MNTSALIMYLSANIVVTVFTVYFFVKVLKAPPHEPIDEHYPGAHEPKTFDAT